MDSIYSIVHITSEENYKKIMEDGYLRPYRSVQLENQRFSNLRDKNSSSFYLFMEQKYFVLFRKR